MSLPHALLTALLEQSSSGFDLAKRFDRSMSYYWHATHQQIYRELAKMEQQGWIESQAAPNSKSRIKTYTVLPAGQHELLRWTQQPSEVIPLREALMIKLRAEALLDAVDLQPEIQARLAEHQQRLKVYLQIETEYFAMPNPTRPQRLRHLILQTGMQHERNSMAWLEQMLQVLHQQQKTD